MENFLQPIESNVQTVNVIVRATICLHNFLIQTTNAAYCPKGFTDNYNSTGQIKEGEWRAMVKFNDGMLKNITAVQGSRTSLSALDVQNEVKRYVNSINSKGPYLGNGNI